MEYVLYYLILGERKELSRHGSWQAAHTAAAQRKHNYCGSSLYIEEAPNFDRWAVEQRKVDHEFTKAFKPNRHGEYA